MLKRLRERAGSESGFTLIELLVVMLILGILAAIAIPAFLNQKNKAGDASAKVDARTMQTAEETYSTDNNGSYTGGNLGALQGIEPSLNNVQAGSSATPNAGGTGYTVSAKSTTGNTFSITRAADGTITRACTVPSGADRGGCPTGGTW